MSLNSNWLRTVLVAACLVYSLISLRANYFIPYKEDYKSAYAYLAQERQPGDCDAFGSLPMFSKWAWEIYQGEPLPENSNDCRRTWLITVARPSNSVWMKGLSEARKRLEDSGWDKTREKTYFAVYLDLYESKDSANAIRKFLRRGGRCLRGSAG